jgi:hypothetical protein
MSARRLMTTLVLAVTILAISGCGSSKGGRAGQGARPTTTATLAILQPTPNQTTGSQVMLKLQLDGGFIAPISTNLALAPNTGHIHLYLDNQLISMSQTLNQTLPTLAAGLHTVRAEFVANDHLPWKNRVVAEVAFTVQ